jgi:hypothetical protein
LFNNNKEEQKYERYIKLKGLIRSQMIIFGYGGKEEQQSQLYH